MNIKPPSRYLLTIPEEVYYPKPPVIETSSI